MKNYQKDVFQNFDNYVKSQVERSQRRNILLQNGNKFCLLKYEGHDFEVLDCNSHRVNRNSYVSTFNWFLARTKEERRKIEERQNREWKRYQGNIYGTHCLDFEMDEEFGIYLPSSSRRDVFITLATESVDGKVTPMQSIEIIAGDQIISARLREITRPKYFDSVISPFLDSWPTAYQVPRWKNRWFFKTNRWKLLEKYEKVVKELDHGAFVYVGCKEEVYLLALAKDNDGKPYMQGTYTTSASQPFYSCNNYLDFISRFNAEKTKFKGNGSCNVVRYRTYDIPGFNDISFVFPQMGRSQDCKNTIFTGEPDIITGDIDEALAHFETTDFSEFSDIVKKYEETILIHLSSGKPNGRYYY